MKKPLHVAMALLAGVSSLSMYHSFSTALLTEEDYRLEREDSLRAPALSAWLDGRSPYWETYNHWQCFPSDAVEIECLKAEYGGIVEVPALHVIAGAHFYEFSMDPEPKPDCKLVTERWKSLIAGEDTFCVYAAYLQNFDGGPPSSAVRDGSVWIAARLKTAKGLWRFESDENWLKEDIGDDVSDPVDEAGDQDEDGAGENSPQMSDHR